MTREEKIQKLIAILAEKSEEIGSKLRRANQQEEEGMRGIGVFLAMIEAKEVAEALEVLHQEINLI